MLQDVMFLDQLFTLALHSWLCSELCVLLVLNWMIQAIENTTSVCTYIINTVAGARENKFTDKDC